MESLGWEVKLEADATEVKFNMWFLQVLYLREAVLCRCEYMQ